MKIWFSHGSEHSHNLMLIGTFKDASSAGTAQTVIERLRNQAEVDRENGELRFDNTSSRFSSAMLKLLDSVGQYSLGPLDLEQLLYAMDITLEGNVISIWTEEIDVQVYVKVLIDLGARLEIFSGHEESEASGPDESRSEAI